MNYLSRPEHLIIEAVGRFRYLSAFQLNRLLYGNSLSHVQKHASQLHHSGFLAYLPLPNYQQGGRNRRVYYLTAQGSKYLKELSLAHRSPKEKPTYQTLQHSLSINDMLIAAHKISGFALTEFRTEFELKSIGGSVCPDATFTLERNGEVFPIVLEVDRSTESRKFFKEKVALLIPYTQKHESLTIAVVISGITDPIDRQVKPDVKRVGDLRRWTEQELTAHRAEPLGQIFYFASFDTDRDDLNTVFCSPVWHTPYSDEPTALLSSD